MARLCGVDCPCHGTGEQVAGHTVTCWNLWLESRAIADQEQYG